MFGFWSRVCVFVPKVIVEIRGCTLMKGVLEERAGWVGHPHGDLKAVSRVEKGTMVGRTAFDQEWP